MVAREHTYSCMHHAQYDGHESPHMCMRAGNLPTICVVIVVDVTCSASMCDHADYIYQQLRKLNSELCTRIRCNKITCACAHVCTYVNAYIR